MRENSATHQLYDLVINCPACIGAGWVTAVDDSDLTIACPMCLGHSWVPAVADEVGR